MTFPCAKTSPVFVDSFLYPSFVSTNLSPFSWNLAFEFLSRFCFTRLGVPLASNPSLLSFCTQYATILPTQRTLFWSLFSSVQRTMARGWGGGGGGVKCERVESKFNQELTPIRPHPNFILFNPLHCYKKFIHAAGDHHWSRQKYTAGPHTSNKFSGAFGLSGAFRFSGVFFSKCPANSKRPAFSSRDGESPSVNIMNLPGLEHAPHMTGGWHSTKELWRLYIFCVLGSIWQHTAHSCFGGFFQYFWRIFCNNAIPTINY